MFTEKNRPVITDSDYPEIIVDALRQSIVHANSGALGVSDPWLWRHHATNSYETVQDEFQSIDGEYWRPAPRQAVLWEQSPDTLELALVAYGTEEERTDDEMRHIDELLVSIDGLKSHRQS